MSVVDPQLPEQASVNRNTLISSPHGDVDADQHKEPITSQQSEAGDQTTDSGSVNGSLSVASTPMDENIAPKDPEQASVPTSPEGGKKEASPAAKRRTTMSLVTKVSPTKANGDPPTPLVKKIISSGTFGAGSVKAAPAVKSTVSGSAATAKPATSAPTLKKATSAAPSATAASKPATATKTPAAAAPAHTRRASVAPAKPAAPATTRNPLSASVNSRPSATESARTRPSVASPTGSVASAKATPATSARPRASVSEAVRKPTITSSRTATTATKPAATTRTTVSRVAPSSGTAKSSASSSSIKEQVDNKVLDEVRGQLKEAEDALKTKADSVAELEAQIEKLQDSLKTALADVESKDALASGLEKAKLELEAQLEQVKSSVSQFESQNGDHQRLLEEAKAELESAKTVGADKASEVEKLQSQVAELEAAVASAEAILKSTQESHAIALSEASQSSSEDHQILLKAQADLKIASDELQSLRIAHKDASENLSAKVAELDSKAAELAELEKQILDFKSERDETANKVSELEVEVLELKEKVEELEDTRDKLDLTVKTLTAELDKSAQVLAESAKAASDKEHALEGEIASLKTSHAVALKEAEDKYNALESNLRDIQDQLQAALAAQEKAAQDVVAAKAAHDEQVKNLEEARAANEAELNAQIAAIRETLENQEAIYDSKVQAVKAEHETRLQEAFERAKSEAGDAHAQELQALQSRSKALVEEIQASNKVTIESLQSGHANTLEETVNEYTKQIGSLNLELKATRDDLAKAKGASETLRSDLEKVTAQLEEVRAAAAAAPVVSPEFEQEMSRLKNELSNTKDDLSSMTEMLGMTKSSLAELSDRHQKDLEEAAKGRADEVMALKHAHDAEVTSLATQKSELLIKLSDLEGELATVRAALAAAETAAPKTNGAVAPQSPSGVTKEDLAKMHEAHNLKVYDLEAQHERELKVLKAELEEAKVKAGELESEVGRKAMEIQYLEQEQDEGQEQITRLKDDLQAMAEKCAKEHGPAAA